MWILQARISELPWSPPGHHPNPGIKPRSPALPADSLASQPPGKLAGYEISKKKKKKVYIDVIKVSQIFQVFVQFRSLSKELC